MLHRIIFAAFEEIAHVGPGFVNSWLLGLEVVVYISSVVVSKNPWKILGFEVISGITCDWYILIAPFASFPMQPYCDPRDPGIFVHNIHIFRWRKLCILKSLGFQMFSRWHLLFPKCLYVISSFTSLWDVQKFSKLRKKQWDDHKTTMARWLRETDFC